MGGRGHRDIDRSQKHWHSAHMHIFWKIICCFHWKVNVLHRQKFLKCQRSRKGEGVRQLAQTEFESAFRSTEKGKSFKWARLDTSIDRFPYNLNTCSLVRYTSNLILAWLRCNFIPRRNPELVVTRFKDFELRSFSGLRIAHALRFGLALAG